MSVTVKELQKSFARFDAIVEDRESDGAYAERMREFKLAFGYIDPPPEDPLGTPFAQSVLDRVRNRWVVDRTAAQDQASGTSFTAMRRGQLEAETGGHYLAREYGLRTAMDENLKDRPKDVPGIRLQHPISSQYLRDAPSKAADESLRQLYDKTKPAGPFSAERMFFVNSPKAADKLIQSFGKDVLGSAPPASRTLPLGPGVHVLVFDDEVMQKDVTERLRSVGATPSSYEVFKQLNGGGATTPLRDENLKSKDEDTDNAVLLSGVTGSAALGQLEALPESHPLKASAETAAKLVAGLETALAKVKDSEGFKKNVLVQSALKSLGSIVDAMPAYSEDTQRFTRLFDLLTDELYLVLATCQPYDGASFKDAASNSLKLRAPVLKDEEVTSYLFSSGMDAISTALTSALAAEGASGVGDTTAPHYFEAPMILSGGEMVKSSGKVIYTTLNPSLPRTSGTASSEATDADKSWDVGKLIAEIGRQCPEGETRTVVIDVTVETGAEDGSDNDLNTLFKHFKPRLDDGSLSFVLSKSYQKYPSLGTGKVMAGGISVVSKNPGIKAALDKSLDESEAALGMMATDEAQIMTHFLATASDQETALLDHAADNAAFAQQFCAGADGWGRYGEGLPFVHTKTFEVRLPGGKKIATGDLLTKMGVEKRDSFSFQNTSIVTIAGTGTADDGVRINTGQESEEEIVEKLYAVGKLAIGKDGTDDPMTIDGLVGLASTAVDGAFSAATTKADPAVWTKPMLATLKAEMARRQRAADANRSAEPEVARQADEAVARLAQIERNLLGALSATPRVERTVQGAVTALKEEYDRWAGVPENATKALASKLNIASASMGPTLASDVREGNEDVSAMRASMQYGWRGTNGTTAWTKEEKNANGFMQNVVVSALNVAGAAFPDPGDKAATLDSLTEALIDTGMARVSPEAREKLLLNWATKAVKGLPGTLPKIKENLKLLPYREANALLLQTGMSKEDFAKLGATDQKDVVDVLLGNLDPRTRLVTLEDLIWTDPAKAEVCAAKIETDLADLKPKFATLPSSATLAEGTAGQQMTSDEFKALQTWFDELKAMLAESDSPLAEPDTMAKGFLPVRRQNFTMVARGMPDKFGTTSYHPHLNILQRLPELTAARPDDAAWDRMKFDRRAAQRVQFKVRKAAQAALAACQVLIEDVKSLTDEQLRAFYVTPPPELTCANLAKEVTPFVGNISGIVDSLKRRI